MRRALVRDRLTGEVAGEVERSTPVDSTLESGPAHAADHGLSVLPDGPGRVEVVVDGWRFEFEVEDAERVALRARATNAKGAQAQHGPTEVRAIIPGRVLSVAVTPGDVVTAGQQLLTVEAMKMQNELRSPRDGTVERVAVGPGSTVDLGDVLVTLG
jgi:biotin carboxyl carrier protein